MITLSGSSLEVSPLCLGGNVFGWTADEHQSFAVLDAYAAAGGNFIDTADLYAAWVPGNSGGESETIIGSWMAARGNRDQMVIATKIGMMGGLGAQVIRDGARRALERLQTDHIDLYYAHSDDANTPLAETLTAFGELVADGLVTHLGASNYSPTRLAEALAISASEGLPAFVAFQPEYNLMEREYEAQARSIVADAGLACIPYSGLASGFLTGKYRAGGDPVASPRAGLTEKYRDERGFAMLDALDLIAAAHEASVSSVALAWLAAQPTVATPIASARTVAQFAELEAFAELTLSAPELELLSSS